MSAVRTPDRRLRVFVSSTLHELAAEREAVRSAIERLRLTPVMFEAGARPHPARVVYRSYLDQSDVFVGIYGARYGVVPEGERVSGLEDEYRRSRGMPTLVYVKDPASGRDPQLEEMLATIRRDDLTSYRCFDSADELGRLVADDLAVLLSDRFAALDDVRADRPPGAPVPVAVTPLIGRDSDLARLERTVLEDRRRLVTLTGPGGVGKSRLAAELAQRIGSRFEHGTAYADLTQVTDPDLVAGAFAGALGVRRFGAADAADLVKAHLRDRTLLLVVDNFEQVTDAAPVLADVLGSARGVTAVTTSRTPLRVSGEHTYEVLPLAVPREARAGTALLRYGAVRLFVDRAGAASPGFAITTENASAVAEIARRLDGLPLAIELAAARMRVLTPAMLLARLDSRLRLLTDGARDLPERQRTLRTTIAWSHDLLSVGERELFARLAVFAGGFDLDAAAAVSGLGELEVLDALATLVDNSLVRRDTVGGEPRFHLLETIREYAIERLRESADWTESHDLHVAHFARLAETAGAALKGPAQPEWLRALEVEHDNLRAALSRLLRQADGERAAGVIEGLWLFWWLDGHLDEASAWLDQLLVLGGSLDPRSLGLASGRAGMLALQRGLGDARAVALLEDSLATLQVAGEPADLVLILAALAQVSAGDGDHARSTMLLDRALRIAEEQDLPWEAALVLDFRGQVLSSEGRAEDAVRANAAAVESARRSGAPALVLLALYNLAIAHQSQGEADAAIALLEEGLGLAAASGYDTSTAHFLRALAVLAASDGDAERAGRLEGAAERLLSGEGGTIWTRLRTIAAAPPLPAPQMPDEAFARGLAEGRRMRGARVLEYALEGG